MSLDSIVAWLDQNEAHRIEFNRDESGSVVIKSGAEHQRVHAKSASAKLAESAHYVEALAQPLKNAPEVLIVWPGLEKLNLLKHLMKHHHQEAEKVAGMETVDRPSDGQLLAYSRKYSHRVDQMR